MISSDLALRIPLVRLAPPEPGFGHGEQYHSKALPAERADAVHFCPMCGASKQSASADTFQNLEEAEHGRANLSEQLEQAGAALYLPQG